MGKTDKFVALAREAGISPQTVYDIGAFTGEQTLELARAWPQAFVVAFEADPDLAAECRKTIGQTPRITFVEAAAGSKSGTATFYKAVGRNKECGSLLRPNGMYFEPMPTMAISVPAFPISALIESGLFYPPDAVWMDVQGVERDVLEGLGQYLSSVKIIWTEVAFKAYYQDQMLVSEFDHYMTDQGFRLIGEFSGIPEWFGDRCYVNKKL